MYRAFPSSDKFIPSYCILFDAIVNIIVSLIPPSDSCLLGYKNATDFCILILYPEALLNDSISFYSFLVESFREGNGTPLQYSCLENPMDGGAWWAAVHGVAKSQTQLSNITFTFHFHALKKEMATYSSVLAWRIPGTAEPGGLPGGVAESDMTEAT